MGRGWVDDMEAALVGRECGGGARAVETSIRLLMFLAGEVMLDGRCL